MGLFSGTLGKEITTIVQRNQSPDVQNDEQCEDQARSNRGLIWFLVIGMVLFSVIVAWVILDKIETQSRQDIQVALHTIIQTTQEALHNEVIKRLTEVTSWSLSSELQGLIKEQLNVKRNPQALLKSQALAKMRELLNPVMEEKGYIGFFVIASDSISIASMRNTNVGTTNLLAEQENFLPLIFEGNVLASHLLPSDVALPDALGNMAIDQPTMFVAAPVREQGTTLAVLAFRVDPINDFSSITKLGRIGEKGETYAFNESGKMITESRFEKQLWKIGILAPGMRSTLNVDVRDPGVNLLEGSHPIVSSSKQPLTYMAQQAIKGGTGDNLDGYRDYRGVPVVGAWTWNDELGFGLATEIDLLEAYRTYHTSRWALLIGLALTVALSLGLSITLEVGRKRAVVLARKIKDSQRRLHGILENLVEGVVTVDKEGTLQSFNSAAEKIFGYRESEIIGQNISLLVPKSCQNNDADYTKIMKVFRTGEAYSQMLRPEISGRRKNGSTFSLDVSSGEMILDEHQWLVVSMRDITESNRLKEEVGKLTMAVEQNPASIVVTNLDGEIEYVNRKFTQVTGYSKEEVIGKNPRFLKSGYLSSKAYQHLWKTISAGETWRGEFHNKKKNSELYWELASISPIKDKNGMVSHYLAVKEDITRRKVVETKLKTSKQELRDLYNRLQAVREEERTSISREIHDELGQMLTALKIDVSWLIKKLSNKERTVQDRAHAMSSLLDTTIKSVQSISTHLRPAVLDMLGLSEAIEWQVQEFQKRTGTKCNVTSSVPDLNLDPELSTTVFRILQEALTNVARHAEASILNIGLYKKHNELVLKVQDNGKGISDDKNSARKSLGLLGIRERVLLWNGRVKINGAKGHGTTILVEIPVSRS
jgi:polar amino acid transport system substrate-binding protein